jgi:hypothetical protein
VYIIFFVQSIHEDDVHENQEDEYINRTLLGPPKGATDDAKAVGYDEPYSHEDADVQEVGLPVLLEIFVTHGILI